MLEARGGFVDPRLGLQRAEHGLGLVAKAPIKKGELVLWLPATLVFRSRKRLRLPDEAALGIASARRAELDPVAGWLVAGSRDFFPRVAETAAALALEIRRGNSSRHAAYFGALPKHCPSSLAAAAPEVRRWARSTPAKWTEGYLRSVRVAVRHLLDGTGVGDAEQLWAVCMVLSRSFTSAEGSECELWPGLDSANHAAEGDASARLWKPRPAELAGTDDWESYLAMGSPARGLPREDGVGLTAARALSPGEEIRISYGERGAFEFLALYGFEDARRPMMAPLVLPPVRGAPRLTEKARARLESHECYTDEDVLLTIRGLEVPRGAFELDAVMLRIASRCLRVWLREPDEVDASTPFDKADVPLLESIQVACEQLALGWVRSIAFLTPEVAETPFASSARREAVAAERCIALARGVIASVRSGASAL